MSDLILASGSPRRRQLLNLAGFAIAAVRPPNIPEIRDHSESPLAYARRLSKEKARAVDVSGAWILAADTIVHRGDNLYEKPTDDADAVRMLTELSGQWHRVTTAWCLRWSGPGPSDCGRRIIRGHRTSRVRFRSLTPVEIKRYTATGEGRDKAGAYAVQGDGASLIDRVVGSTTNVVGLPLDAVVPALLSVGLSREIA
jgi:septum formation protein